MIKRFYTQEGNREKLAEVIIRQTKMGFNRGTEVSWTMIKSRDMQTRRLNKRKLLNEHQDFSISMEDVQMAQRKEEQSRKKQEELRKRKERFIDKPYDSNYKPTVSELRKKRPYLETVRGNNKHTIYHVQEKGCWVSLLELEGEKPKIFKAKTRQLLNQRSYQIFQDKTKHLITPWTQEESPLTQQSQPRRTRQQSSNDDMNIDIGHVREAMGMDEQPNNNRNKNNGGDIDDILEGLF
jgi:hypothetical protein